MEKVQTKFVNISDLKLLKGNPRQISKENFEKLCNSIKENPDYFWARPILVNDISGENIVYAGNQRLRAAKKIGLKEVPCIIERLSEEKEKERTIRDNVELGEWDFDILANEWDIEKLEEWSVEIPNIDILSEDGLTDPDEVPEKPEKPKTKNGDLYELGMHKIFCGDSTIFSDVEKLMSGKLADCVWTDPPYNVDYEGSDGKKIKNDKMKDDSFYNFLKDSFLGAFALMKKGSAIYIAHSDTEGFNFRKAFNAAGFKLSGCLIWEKPSLVLGRSDYQWRHEPILYGWKKGDRHKWFGGRKNTTIFNKIIENVLEINHDSNSVIINIDGEFLEISGENLKVNGIETSIIKNDKPKKNEDHPTMKPTELISRMIQNSTKKGEIVLDLFLGSGSTMISCEQIGRKCFGLELDEKYCDVIVKRWLDFTGETEFKLNGQKITKEKWESLK